MPLRSAEAPEPHAGLTWRVTVGNRQEESRDPFHRQSVGWIRRRVSE